MNLHHLNALRLGFSTKDASSIKSLGIQKYIKDQLGTKISMSEPTFFENSPKNLEAFKAFRQPKKNNLGNLEDIKKELVKTNFNFKAYIIERYDNTDFPLREKINLFFQNHFVVTLQSLRFPYWVFKHYETIHSFSTGNYKTLVKEVISTNAMIKYLDNQQNVKGKVNENLGRELLELFTLGEGHYTESDIKNTALALAGLSFGEQKGMYRPMLKDNSIKTIFGKSGNFDINDVVDLIFEQPNTPYFLAEKVLKWFFYDNPPKDLITKYGDILRQNKFELKPFFEALFIQECQNTSGGNQIKNPLVFLLQVHQDLNLTPNYKLLAILLKNQSMDIYDQPNVKGWKGGKDWLTSQIYADRNQLIDFLTEGNERFLKGLNKRLERFDIELLPFTPNIRLKNPTNAKNILEELSSQMIFKTNPQITEELNQLLKYDFDPSAENAQKNILNVYQYLAKLPEFQLI